MLWPVERGEEVPVGWSYWCFLQGGGRIFVFQREGKFLFWAAPPPPIQCLVKGGERPDMWGGRRWGFFLTAAALCWAGRLAAHACALHPQQSERLRAAASLEGVWCVLFHLRVCHSASPQQPRVSWTRRRTSRWARLSLLSLSVSSSSSRPLSLPLTIEACAVKLSPKIIERDVNWSLLELKLKPFGFGFEAYCP